MEPMEALEIIAKAVDGAGADHAALRKRAEDVYDAVVEGIRERDGCGARDAHYRAARDPVAKAAYNLARTCREREAASKAAAARLGSVLG